MYKFTISMPPTPSPEAIRFAALVSECERNGSTNPVLQAAARDPKLYGKYRASFIKSASAGQPGSQESSDARAFEREFTHLSRRMSRGAAIAQIARTQPKLYNAARVAGLI